MGKIMIALLLFAAPAAAQYDLLIQGGHVVDPKNKIDTVMDVAVADGKIAAVAQKIDPARAAKSDRRPRTLRYTRESSTSTRTCLPRPGIPNAWAGDNSVLPDGFSFRSGTTTMVDAGSAGWRNFEAFRQTVIDRVRTRVLAFVNIVGLGMVSNFVEQDVEGNEPRRGRAHCGKTPRCRGGMKTAHYEGKDWTAVDRAVEGRQAVGTARSWSTSASSPPSGRTGGSSPSGFDPGDISTHMYRSGVPYLDKGGRLLAYLRNRPGHAGVKFDLGHGGGSFVFRNAVPAVQQGFYPDSISTDLHTGSMNGAMMDFPNLMSKMLVMGMPFADIVLRSTWMPASEVIHRPEFGHLTGRLARGRRRVENRQRRVRLRRQQAAAACPGSSASTAK